MATRKQLPQLLAGGLVAIIAMQLAIADPVSSYAFVRPDGSLEIAGHHIYLYGIYVPPTTETCYTFGSPILCGPRASIALEFKISGNFVDCIPRATNPDGSFIAICTLDGEDLSTWMLENGWAVALPDAPSDYQALERVARNKGVGVWGPPSDSFRRRRSR